MSLVLSKLLLWSLRKHFWDRIAIAKYKANRPATIPAPQPMERRIKMVPLRSQFPEIPIDNIIVADHVPADEESVLKHVFYEFQVGMYSIYPPMQPGLPEIDPNTEEALLEAYTEDHRECFPAPQRPPEYRGDDIPDLGFLAVASPYACYLERAPEGGYQWDLRELKNYEHYDGLRSLAMRVVFEADPGTRQLRATHIESELGMTRLDDAAWPLARKIALCAASTYISLVRHFNWVHLACGGPVAIVTRNELPHDHPLKRLLWPHIFGTQYSNAIVTKGQMAPGGDFDSIFSFTHAGMCQLFRDSYDKYPITVIDPERDAQRRGVLHGEFDQPSLHNLTALFAVMHAHADRYVRAYYGTDDALRADQSVRNWLDHMDKLIPNGIGALVDDVNRASVARFIGGLIYMATVQHDVLGTSMWNYQMWVDKQPVRIYRNGQREPLDVFQRLVNANFNLNVNRKNLLDDFSYLGLDATGMALFRQFQDDLKVLQGRMEAEEFAYWKIYPTILEANINA